MPEKKMETFSFKVAENKIHIAMDLINACNLSCPTCWRGNRFMKNSNYIMDYDLFCKIIDKADRIGCHSIDLFNWSEPFLVKNIKDYMMYIKKVNNNIKINISSNLSIKDSDHIIPSLKFCDKLIISLSGFTQKIYEQNHRGGNIEIVKENLIKIGLAKKLGLIDTNITIRYFIFPHSEHEYVKFETFANKIGLNIIRWAGGGNIHNQQCHDEPLSKFINIEILPRFFNIYRTFQGKACICSIMTVIIDANGDCYLCCLQPNLPVTKIGSFVNDDFDIISYRRVSHPLCRTCNRVAKKDAAIPKKILHRCIRGFSKSISFDNRFINR